MNNNRIDTLIGFLKEIDRFKEIRRNIYLSNKTELETDSDHSWHVAMFILVFQKELKGLNLAKMLKMALVHDLVEIYAGDTFSYDSNSRETKKNREEKSLNKLFSNLPKDIREDFWQSFYEYEESKSKEAKIVQAFDKLQPIMQNITSEGKSWKKNKITIDMVKSYKDKFMTGDKTIKHIYQSLLDESRSKKLIN